MNELKKVGREAAKASAKLEQKKEKPDYLGAIAATLVWLVAIFMLMVGNAPSVAILVAVAAVALIVAGCFWRPLRSGYTGWWVAMVPVWGIVARSDQISTCKALRRAGIYTDDDKTKTIPATTYKRGSDVFVQFDGNGEAGMSPEALRELLSTNARVWGCRSFAISEEVAHPGRWTIQLSPHDHVDNPLDHAVIGVVA